MSNLSHLTKSFSQKLKQKDIFSSQAHFRLPHKTGSAEEDDDTSQGSIYGGMLSMLGYAIYAYLIVFGLIKMLSGKYDRIIELKQENTYTFPDNEVIFFNYNYMPTVAIDLDTTNLVDKS